MTSNIAGRLPLTGERTVPGIEEENYWFRRHEAAYVALAPYCAGAVVLEAGCGEGYGADLFAATSCTAIGTPDRSTRFRRNVATRLSAFTTRGNSAVKIF